MSKIKNLPPEERLKKLRKLRDKRKKEIHQAELDIKNSEQEITERKKWADKVPIPEMAKDDLQGISEAAKEILKVQRGLVERSVFGKMGNDDSVNNPGSVSQRKKSKDRDTNISGLEETVEHESINVAGSSNIQYGSAQLAAPSSQYVQDLSLQPLSQLQNEIKSIYQNVREQGYMTTDQQRFIQNRGAAIEEKIQAGQSGNYQNWNEEVANAAFLAKQLTGRLLDDNYHSNTRSQVRHDYKNGT